MSTWVPLIAVAGGALVVGLMALLLRSPSMAAPRGRRWMGWSLLAAMAGVLVVSLLL